MSLNSNPIKSPTYYCQQLATAATLKCGSWYKLQRWAPLTCDTQKWIKQV